MDKQKENSSKEPARRACLWKFVPAEKAIYDAVEIIESMGADPLLTEAQCLLMKAQQKVADYIDNVLPPKQNNPFNPPIMSVFEELKIKGSPETSVDKYFDGLLKTGSF